MPDHRPGDLKDEMKMLGRGIFRTFVRDVLVIGGCAALGALVGYIAGSILFPGFGRTYALIGVIIGMTVGLLLRTYIARLFDFERPPPGNGRE
jgi:hypothetical protein